MKIGKGALRAVVFFVLLFMAAALAIAALAENKGQDKLALRQDKLAIEKEFDLGAEGSVYIRSGLHFTIQSVIIPSDRRPVVTFKITDDMDQPLDRSGVLTPGAVSSSFILAYLEPIVGNIPQYVSYSTRTVTSPITNVTTNQAGTDSGGAYTSLGDGWYSYRFGTTLPANYNASLTHTIGVYGNRNLTEFGMSVYLADGTMDFVPNGAPLSQTRQLVLTTNCNQCHDPLSAHGTTGRSSAAVCILCHSPQTIDPDTGEAMDMKVMIHKIHRGGDLPSGNPYIVIGHNQSVADFSGVVFPQDIRNCDTCHKNSEQTNAWKLFPNRAACGSCHDDVNFMTGENHPAGAYSDDSQCASCHQPQGEFEYDASVMGAHTVPYKSNQLVYPKITFISLTNTAPGQKPVLKFKITDKDNNLIAPSTMSRLSANVAGPTTDYTTRFTETLTSASFADGVATYNFTNAIPDTATGSFALELEGRINADLIKNGDPTDTISQRDAADNVVVYFAVTGSNVVPRREVVSIDNCNQCHEKLQLHGSNRNQTKACVVCHNPTLENDGESFSFQYMIHKIHTGEELHYPYLGFEEVLFPGDRRDCNKCHIGTTFTIPLPATNIATITPANFWSPTQPVATACLACHDSVSTAAHAYLNTVTLGNMEIETCEVCHKEGADFAVSKVHER